MNNSVSTQSHPQTTVTILADVRFAHIAGDHGAFKDGYTPDDANRVLSRVKAATGIDVSIIWDLYDDSGFGGDSDFAIYRDGKLFEAEGLKELSDYLSGRSRRCPSDLSVTLGPGIMWAKDSDCNFAREDLS